jgi:hypothetical protein
LRIADGAIDLDHSARFVEPLTGDSAEPISRRERRRFRQGALVWPEHVHCGFVGGHNRVRIAAGLIIGAPSVDGKIVIAL